MNNKNIMLGKDFLNIADRITECYGDESRRECSMQKSEGLIRSGISRAYYAAFIIARYAVGLEYLRGKDIHEKVITRLKEDGHEDIADKLFELRMKRNNADYDVYKHIPVRMLEWATITAKEVIDEILKRYKYRISMNTI